MAQRTSPPLKLWPGELVTTHYLNPEQSLPLVVEPAVHGVSLADWAANHRDFIEGALLTHGALLFRNFNVNSVAEFHQAASAICPSLQFYANSRQDGDAAGNIRTAVTYPADKKLMWHNEDNFNHFYWPRKIMFYCLKPARQGGETPLVDCRRVFERIDPEIRARFVEKGIMYVKNYWQELGLTLSKDFGTSDRCKVENYCRKTDTHFEWVEERLRIRFIRPAAVRHPKTGEMIWFNVAQLSHLSCFDPEIRDALVSAFPAEELPLNCYYGDGSAIEDSVMRAVCDAYQRAEVVFRWRAGDTLVAENMLVAHGRNPFVGEREHFVAVGETVTCKDLASGS